MKVHELSFYTQFQCIAGSCPDTCCHGWQIILDNETIQKYTAQTNIRSLLLCRKLTRKNGAVMFKNSTGNCPFLSRNRLCNIQLSLGEDYLPDVCRVFPRQRINYGPFAEELLFLACPQACRLFLDNLGQLHYKTVEREVFYAKTGTNDDPGYLQELLEIRLSLTTQIMDSVLPLPMLYAGLLSYAKALQQSYLSNTYSNTIPVRPDLIAHLHQAATPFAIPHQTTYAILTAGFYHIFLKSTSPFLYRLCRIYLKKFHRLAADKANAILLALKDNLHSNHPKAGHILRGYLAYYLLEEFFITYEDYSFLRNIAIGIMHTCLLELFFALYYDENNRLEEDDMIQIITVYTRRARHNDSIERDMYEKLKCYLDCSVLS